jgi:membrane protein implicated in regulation of membrane protease activity
VNVLAFLNPTMASSFLIGLGGGGVLSRVSGAGALPSLACASVGGGLCYYWAWWLIVRFFGGAQLSSHTRRTDLVGVRAQVTAPIEGSRPGMIAFTIAGSRQTARAITSEDDTITVGSAVRIRRINKDAVVVSRIEGRS